MLYDGFTALPVSGLGVRYTQPPIIIIHNSAVKPDLTSGAARPAHDDKKYFVQVFLVGFVLIIHGYGSIP